MLAGCRDFFSFQCVIQFLALFLKIIVKSVSPLGHRILTNENVAVIDLFA